LIGELGGGLLGCVSGSFQCVHKMKIEIKMKMKKKKKYAMQD